MCGHICLQTDTIVGTTLLKYVVVTCIVCSAIDSFTTGWSVKKTLNFCLFLCKTCVSLNKKTAINAVVTWALPLHLCTIRLASFQNLLYIMTFSWHHCWHVNMMPFYSRQARSNARHLADWKLIQNNDAHSSIVWVAVIHALCDSGLFTLLQISMSLKILLSPDSKPYCKLVLSLKEDSAFC